MLCKHVPIKSFSIFQPRWHDRKVLLAAHKVGEHNKVVFTKAPTLGEEPYYVSGKIVKKAKKESNGTIDCYAVKLSELEPLEMAERCEHEWK